MIRFMNWRFRPTDPIWILANTIHGIFYSRIRRAIGIQWRGGFVGVIMTERGKLAPDDKKGGEG